MLSPFKQLPTSTLLTRLQQRTDTVAALYLLITGAIVSFHHAQLPSWRVYLSVHLLAATGICMLRRLPLRRLTGVTGFFRDWYPVLLFPVLYKEVERFALAFGDWRLTKSIQQLEVALFGGHPSLYASCAIPVGTVVGVSALLLLCVSAASANRRRLVVLYRSAP